ncbi:MAG: membrane protein insertase YidC, partial [Verrucomicrobiota bacterium]
WGGFAMKTDRAKSEASFTRRDADGLEITKRFTLPQDETKSDPYVVRMELEFRNAGAVEVSRAGYFVSTGGAAPIHSRDLPIYTRFDWLHDAAKFTGIDVNWFNASAVPLLGIPLSAAKSLYQESKPTVSWAGVASQYFCTIVTTEKTKGVSVWASRLDVDPLSATPIHGIQGGLGMPKFTLAPGETLQESFLIYAGPKELKRLQNLKADQDLVMNFGMFGFVSKFLLWAMNGFNGIFHSYAIAIILLTLMIKSVLWPVQNKATNQMRKMSLLSPKMAEVKEKYKDDPQKMNAKMMELYKDYGVNPFSGCLPMLIQIPIFFGFYSMLGSAIELRNSQFLWIHDLSQPDTVGHIPGLNFPVNLLPIIMAGTMVWQMAISPKSGDAMQQRMMLFMPVIFLVFCYNYASGLALYWTTQNLFSIVQLYLTRNKPLPTLEKKSVAVKRESVATSKKKKRPGQ